MQAYYRVRIGEWVWIARSRTHHSSEGGGGALCERGVRFGSSSENIRSRNGIERRLSTPVDRKIKEDVTVGGEAVAG